MFGKEPQDISALFFINYCACAGGLINLRSDRAGGGQALRARKGTQQFALRIAEIVKDSLHLSTKATKITQLENQRVIVETEPSHGIGQGTSFYAKKSIIATPPTTLQEIYFQPRLPQRKQLAAGSYNYGYYQKVIVAFRLPFWVSGGYCGLTSSFTGPACVIRDTSVPEDDAWVLTCFLAGEPGRDWSQLPKQEAEDALLQQISKLFNYPEAKDLLLEIVVTSWQTEAYNGYGCPTSSLGPGVISSIGSALREPFGNVHFAGTETAVNWKGFMEGAMQSGARTADEVRELLTPRKK